MKGCQNPHRQSVEAVKNCFSMKVPSSAIEDVFIA